MNNYIDNDTMSSKDIRGNGFSSDSYKILRIVLHIIFSLFPALGGILMIYAPICKAQIKGDYLTLSAKDILTPHQKLYRPYIYVQISALVFILLFIVLSMYFVIRNFYSLTNERALAKRTQKSIIIATVTTALYSIFCTIYPSISNIFVRYASPVINLTPLIFMATIATLYAIFLTLARISTDTQRKNFLHENYPEIWKKHRQLSRARFELFIYTLITSAIAVVCILMRVITIRIEYDGNVIKKLSFTGFKLLMDTTSFVSAAERAVAYAIFIMLVINLAFAFMSLLSYLGRSEFYAKLSIATITVGTVTCLLVGLFGKYYELIKLIDLGLLSELLSGTGIEVDEIIKYTTSSYSIWFFAGSIAFIGIILLRRPFTKITSLTHQIAAHEDAMVSRAVEISNTGSQDGDNVSGSNESIEAVKTISDPCPAFTEIDSHVGEYASTLENRRAALFEEPTLPRLVDFIVEYARNSRLHLFYTNEGIASFLAGLGTTKLSILQGMSGTGKTSLPKIVAEALMSVCDIVEIESSWRDKNELLGYYNEFSKTYTPKKFTQALYKARLNPEVLTFIVLDEMNLSRIEYYFSDFLSLMENEPDRREIKLLNVPLFRKEDNESVPYIGLTDGHTVKIPDNIWFIGTANRDESTFDISDKVYDRAYTINFDKRAVKSAEFGEALSPKYLPVDLLNALFVQAKNSVHFSLDDYPVISEVEKLLEPYNISFGNRIAMQIESFVKIYVSCFDYSEEVLHDALETILLSKVVRKLELKSIDDKDELAEGFEKLGLQRCSKFIASLKED